MIPYMNVGYEYGKFGELTNEEFKMNRLMIFSSYLDKKIYYKIQDMKTNIYKCDDKNHLKIWLDLNGFKIYRAYIYADELCNHEYMSRYRNNNFDHLICQCFLSHDINN